jgi:hypothetical protein
MWKGVTSEQRMVAVFTPGLPDRGTAFYHFELFTYFSFFFLL